MVENLRETAEWKWLRVEAIVRDNYECQDCGALGGRRGESKLHVHHKTPLKDGGINDMEGLLILCQDCRLDRHHKRKHEERGAVKDDSSGDDATDGPEPPEGVPNRAYVTVKEPKPGYEYYYWQWRDGDPFKNQYIGLVNEVEFEPVEG